MLASLRKLPEVQFAISEANHSDVESSLRIFNCNQVTFSKENIVRNFWIINMEDTRFMQRAIELALKAESEGNLPVGAVITLEGEVVAEGRSAIWVPRFDATRHAEMEALRAVPADVWSSRGELTVYTTLEPCLMCFGAIMLHGVGRVVFGLSDGYGGASKSFSKLPEFFHDQMKNTQWVGPIMPEECGPLHERLLALEGVAAKRDGGDATQSQ